MYFSRGIVHLASEGLESPLVHASAVRTRLREVLGRPEQAVEIWLYPDRVLVQDFSQHVIDFFYIEEYGHTHENLTPEERLHRGNDGVTDDRFRIHRISLGSLILAPLAAVERERFVQGISFSPPWILDMSLLNSPIVRDTLQAGLDRSEEVEALKYQDGIMVWNRSQDTIDFFYPEGGARYDNDPEKRVAANLQHMFVAFLPQFSAVMVHSSGVVRNQRAALFLAPDAGGKTTVLSLSTDGLLLSDDQIILREEAGDIVAHATPFGQMTSGPVQAPLGGLFVLEKAPHFELAPFKPAELVKMLWDEHLYYTSLLPQPLKLRAFDLFYEMCHRVPVYRMRFPKDYVDWDAIDAAMA
ncbi:MAG: hypothetical protein KKA73_10055 [Chloroflexi bacterium]|nr:hypothetical protein [Chloroflexota bacterium]MBU1748020.1 hypothetical protein [Chloroflexota bacterium]